MSKTIDICKAIQNLPDELITPEIYKAGIREGQIEILNLLPPEYLTQENINTVIDRKKYSWSGYDLNRIPENARTTRICEVAVEKKTSNFLEVPIGKRTTSMLKCLVSDAASLLHYFPEVPTGTWDEESVYTGISSIYRSGESTGYGYRGYSGGSSDKKMQMRMIQVFLYYVPENLKSMSFYLRLFTQTGMDIKHIDFLTPGKFKKHSYYVEVSKKDIKAVPTNKLTSAILKIALLSDKNSIHIFFDEKKGIKEKMFELMDDEMAEIVLKKSPAYLNNLPKKFQTRNRLILALENYSESSYNLDRVYSKYDTAKFDTDICKALVKKDGKCPEFAETIWRQDFVDFCLENAPSFEWFKQMPARFQTLDMVNKAVRHSLWKLEYVLPEFISFDIAAEAFRSKSSYNGFEYRKFVPAHYLNNFKMETGLPVEFFAGERTYSELRERREDYTYCIVGNCYIGYFVDQDSRNKYPRLIMTRRTPLQIQPSIVFSRVIGTYHATWLEKLVADNDPQFEKPAVDKGLKGKQVNTYMGVRLVETVDGVKIYAHSFLGENIKYTALGESIDIESKSLDGIKKKLFEEAVC